ncbi:hypothetical protein [Thermogemmatispora carboxidivorans]|uniref:hypothetical protein n=1 Tax=Thermogemmatispora carboxidivorans TaxID=1382306 RepID=UPI00069A0E80|nr:hypothetical protein [Thermogemmatispora carboxidivorans]
MNHTRRRARGRLLAGTAPLPLIPRSEWGRAALLLGDVSRLLVPLLSAAGQQSWLTWLQTCRTQGPAEALLLPIRLGDPEETNLLSVLQQLELAHALLQARCREAEDLGSDWLLLDELEARELRWLLGLVERFLRRFLRRPRASLSDQTLAQLRQGPPLLRRLGRAVRFQPRREGLN